MSGLIARASEASTHWYGADGSPQYTVVAKDGVNRPTTLRDARKFGYFPSVTTVMKIMAKPGLDVWKQEQLILACMTLPAVNGETEKQYLQRVVADSKETGKRAAEAGTRIHESIERHYRGETNIEHPATAKAFDVAVQAHFVLPEKHAFEAEKSFKAGHGFGGKVDLYCKPGDSAPNGLVIDAKTKDFGPDDKVDAYDEMLMQLAAYRVGLDMPHARCANVFASRTHPGLIKVVEWSAEDLSRGWKMFESILTFWKLKNSFGV